MTHLRISWAQQQQATGTAGRREARATAADGLLASVARPIEGHRAPDPVGHSGWVA